MTVRHQLQRNFALTLLSVVLWNVAFVALSYWIPIPWLGWTLFLYALVNFPCGIYQTVQKYRKLLNSPFLYLAEIQRLTGDL